MSEPIHFYHRAKKTIETEAVYGEKWLRWAYHTGPGRATVALLLRRALFSHYYGWQMSKRISSARVLPFVIDYDLNAEEFAKHAWEYASFNEFFYRKLKPGARPVAAPEDPALAVLPADGRHLAFQDVEAADGFYVKGKKFTVGELLGDATLASDFAGGAMVISRLCPVDYHRFHFPVTGSPGDAQLINGWLYSVSPIALRTNVHYLVENKRYRTLIETPAFGRVAMLEIGATCVGSIKQLYVSNRPTPKGEEKGFFKFGGSCVITLFQRGRIRFDDDFVAHSAEHRETYAKMGERLGVAV
ncbi:MAG TPA: archaetidylserine decarboxylase [Opitutaceae bacterium]